MRLMILEKGRLRNTLQSKSGAIMIGSHGDCTIHLPDPRIGAHQASLIRDDDGAWWLEIMEAAVPTCLNRAVQKSRAKLHHADEIAILDFSIRFFMESEKSKEEIIRERMLELTKKHGESLPLNTIVHQADRSLTVSKDHLEQMSLLILRLAKAESLSDLLTPLLRAALRSLDAAKSWVGLRRDVAGPIDFQLALARGGVPCERPPVSERMQLRCLDHAQYLCASELVAEGVRSAMAAPLLCNKGIRGMIYVENQQGASPYDEAALDLLAAIAASAAMPIENFLEGAATKQKSLTATEITIARATQDALTPKALPQWDELQVAAYRHMGAARCRDYYDLLKRRDKHAFLILARLTCGNLILLPRLIAEVRAAFRSAALYCEAPLGLARALNWLLYDEATDRCAVDLACAVIDPTSGKLTYTLAGDGVCLGRITADGECEILRAGAIPAVGLTRAAPFESHELTLRNGEVLALASAGIATAISAKGEIFGIDGAKESLSDGIGEPPGQMLSDFAEDLSEFLEGGRCDDDISILLARRE